VILEKCGFESTNEQHDAKEKGESIQISWIAVRSTVCIRIGF